MAISKSSWVLLDLRLLAMGPGHLVVDLEGNLWELLLLL